MEFGFGAGQLYSKRTDITAQGPLRFGAFQELSMDFSGDLKEMYGSNQYALDVARGKSKIECKAKFGQFSGALFNAVFFGGTIATGQTLSIYQEAATIAAPVTLDTSASTASGATLPFTSTTGVVVGQSVTGTNIATGSYVLSFVPNTSVTLNQAISGTVASGAAIAFGPTNTVANAATYTTDLGVRYAASGLPLTYVATAPAQGQYTLGGAAGSYLFAAADAGAAILTDYQYTVMTGLTLTGGNPLMGATPRFQASFTQIYEGLTYTMTFPNCVSSKFSLPTKLDDYTMPEIDFMAYAGAGSPFTLSAAQ
jgi:hypothetical protein